MKFRHQRVTYRKSDNDGKSRFRLPRKPASQSGLAQDTQLSESPKFQPQALDDRYANREIK